MCKIHYKKFKKNSVKKLKYIQPDEVLDRRFNELLNEVLEQVPEEDRRKLYYMSQEELYVIAGKMLAAETLEEFAQCFK